jgi:hypothetical protein
MDTPNPNPNPYQQPPQYQPRQPEVPNATAVLVLGIISIVGALCYGIVGLICGIIALYLAAQAKKAHEADPLRYSTSSYNNMNAGRICALIGTILSVLFLIGMIFYIIFVVNLMEDQMGRFPFR